VWALLRTGRWIGFTAAVVAAIVAFGFLSAWQWSRAEERRVDRLELTTRLTAEPQPLGSPGDGSPEYSRVTVEGAFIEGGDRLVRSRPQGGGNGFWVVSALEPRNAPGTHVWVVRGWLASQAAATTSIPVPPSPSGSTVITGYLRDFEDTGSTPADLPAAQITAMSTAQLPQLEGDVYPRWIQSSQEEIGLEILVLPDIDESRNISYAVQWILFAAVAICGWFVFLRREARENSQVSVPAN
jgi:cytochrome oxidase assembly protein ShyY1